MKKVLILVLSLVLVFLLWGCECSHQWEAATCTSGEVCSKCGEIHGEPAGHDWKKATCDTPEICRVCGETQGEPGHTWKDATCSNAKTCSACGLKEGTSLAHDYVFDKFMNDEMQYRCQVCSAVKNEPMDRELYAYHLIVGFWDLYAVQTGTTQAIASNTTEVGAYLVGKEDGAIQFHLEDGLVLDLTMEFVGYEATDLGGSYSLVFAAQDDIRYEAVLTEQNGQKQLTIDLDGNKSVILQQNPELADAVAHTWYDIGQDRLYLMDLKSDRTFTANFDGGISGTWHIKPIYLHYGYDTFNLALSYNLDEKPTVRNLIIILAPQGEGMASLNDPMYSMSMQRFNDFKTQTQINMRIPYDENDVFAVIPEDAASIVGSWETRDVYYYSYEDMTSSQLENPGYTAVFHEDGTFEIQLNSPVKGKWYYICTQTQQGVDYPVINLKTDNVPWYITLYVRPYGSEFEWSYSEYVNNNTTEYVFVRAD